jgi:hypothetical protein
MLFDLQGKRRRVVQGVYLTLAVLMGGGLVLFGIGGDVQGGLFDAFSGGGGSSGNEAVEERVDENEDRVAGNPNALAARKELVRDYYSLAVSQTDPNTGAFPVDAQDEPRDAAKHWTAYLKAEKGEPDTSLARLAIQLYDPTALDQPQQAVKAASIIAADSKDSASYGQVVQYALLAGDRRTEKVASRKAIELAPRNQRKAVRKQLEQLKAQVIAQQLQQQGKLDVEPTTGKNAQNGKDAKQQGGK